MAEAILIKSGGGGTTSDDVTATRNDVLKGTTAITSDSDDDAIDGTLELTGNALPENVLIGRTFYNIDAHTKLVGAMPNNLEINGELLCGESKTIPLGYTSGGVITAKSLASQTGVDTDKVAADDPQILTGYQAWSNGIKRTGSMPHLTNNSTITHTSSNQTKVVLGDAVYVSTNSDGVVRAEIRYNGDNGYIASNTLIAVSQSDMASAAGLTASKIPSGQTVLGINGTYTSDGTASAGHILNGYIAYSKGTKLTGSMANRGAVTSSLNCGGSYTIPAGYHNGSGKVTANSLSSQTSATATAAQILSGKTAWVNGSKLTGTIASLAGSTITPSSSQQTVSCSGKYMTGNIVINAVPSTYLAPGTWSAFNYGAFPISDLGFAPYYYTVSDSTTPVSRVTSLAISSYTDDGLMIGATYSNGNGLYFNKLFPVKKIKSYSYTIRAGLTSGASGYHVMVQIIFSYKNTDGTYTCYKDLRIIYESTVSFTDYSGTITPDFSSCPYDELAVGIYILGRKTKAYLKSFSFTF